MAGGAEGAHKRGAAGKGKPRKKTSAVIVWAKNAAAAHAAGKARRCRSCHQKGEWKQKVNAVGMWYWDPLPEVSMSCMPHRVLQVWNP